MKYLLYIFSALLFSSFSFMSNPGAQVIENWIEERKFQ